MDQGKVVRWDEQEKKKGDRSISHRHEPISYQTPSQPVESQHKPSSCCEPKAPQALLCCSVLSSDDDLFCTLANNKPPHLTSQTGRPDPEWQAYMY